MYIFLDPANILLETYAINILIHLCKVKSLSLSNAYISLHHSSPKRKQPKYSSKGDLMNVPIALDTSIKKDAQGILLSLKSKIT